MAQPPRPVTLLADHTYIHVTSPVPPSDLDLDLASSSPRPAVLLRLEYRGPIGEIQGEHIFELVTSDGAPVPPKGGDDVDVVQVLNTVKNKQGVKTAKVVETRQRSKRDEF